MPQPAPSGGLPQADDVRVQLARLLASNAFPASPRRRRLLEYVVEQTLTGHGDRLKAYELAVAVLERNANFNSQGDPIVRVEMAQLRRDLEHYYLAEGRAEPIRITIPKGHYIPAFEVRDQQSASETRGPVASPGRRFRWHLHIGWRTGAAVGLAALLLVASAWGWLEWRTVEQQIGPAVIVLPFEPLSGGEDGRLLASGLTNGLIVDLMRFDGMQVFAGLPSSQGRAELPPAAAEAPAYVVAGGVERAPTRVRVTARLSDRDSLQVLWSRTYDRALTATDIFDVQADLSAAIVGQLAQVYGVITAAATSGLRRTRPETLFAYDCVQRAFAYRRTFAMELYPSVRACLEEAVRRDAGYAGAWAMLAFAHLDAARYGLVEPAARAGELDAGLAAAQRAVELAPGSVRSLQSLAALRFGRGEYDEAESVQRRAIALNPHDPESLAQLGWRLVVRGQWEEGGTLLQEAINRSMVVPAWYHETLAVARYLGGDLQRARDEAELGKEDCCPGYAILAITEAALGKTAAARAALDAALRQTPQLARDPAAYWANFQVAPEVIERLNVGLVKAGLQRVFGDEDFALYDANVDPEFPRVSVAAPDLLRQATGIGPERRLEGA